LEIEQSELVKVHEILKEFPQSMTVSQVSKSIELSFQLAPPPTEGQLVKRVVKRTWYDHILLAGSVAAIMIVGLTIINNVAQY